jgi:hypothetical protein
MLATTANERQQSAATPPMNMAAASVIGSAPHGSAAPLDNGHPQGKRKADGGTR